MPTTNNTSTNMPTTNTTNMCSTNMMQLTTTVTRTARDPQQYSGAGSKFRGGPGGGKYPHIISYILFNMILSLNVLFGSVSLTLFLLFGGVVLDTYYSFFSVPVVNTTNASNIVCTNATNIANINSSGGSSSGSNTTANYNTTSSNYNTTSSAMSNNTNTNNNNNKTQAECKTEQTGEQAFSTSGSSVPSSVSEKYYLQYGQIFIVLYLIYIFLIDWDRANGKGYKKSIKKFEDWINDTVRQKFENKLLQLKLIKNKNPNPNRFDFRNFMRGKYLI